MSENQTDDGYLKLFREAVGLLIATPEKEAALKAWEAHEIIGQEMAKSIAEVRNLEGFRRVLTRLTSQADNNIEIPKSNLVVYLDEKMPKIWRRQDPNPNPKPLCLNANAIYSQAEAANPSQDLFDKLFRDALAPILVGEDLALVSLMEASLVATGSIPISYQELSEEILMQAWYQMESKQLKVESLVISSSVWNQWMAMPIDGPFIRDFVPTGNHQDVLEGKLGIWKGANVYTDAFRDPNLQMLEPGSIWVLTESKYLGSVSDLTELTSHQVEASIVGELKAGWFIEGTETMAITQPHGVIKLIQSN